MMQVQGVSGFLCVLKVTGSSVLVSRWWGRVPRVRLQLRSETALCSDLQRKPSEPQPLNLQQHHLPTDNFLHLTMFYITIPWKSHRWVKPGPPSALTVGKKHQKKANREKKSPLTHKRHHLQSLGKFLLQSNTMLSMTASQKKHLQNYHRSRSVDVSAGDTGLIGSKTHIFIYLEAIW